MISLDISTHRALVNVASGWKEKNEVGKSNQKKLELLMREIAILVPGSSLFLNISAFFLVVFR